MGQEFFVKSSNLESKVRQLLPSKGGAGAGFDLSASTQIIPIIDLTESAEGSNVRQDLQTALSFKNTTTFNVSNTTTTIISNTGYYRVFGVATMFGSSGNLSFQITDGLSTKTISQYLANGSVLENIPFDFVIFTEAGVSVALNASSTSLRAVGCTRQIADVDGNLINTT